MHKETEKFQHLLRALHSPYSENHYDFLLLGNDEWEAQGLTESHAQLIPLGSLLYLFVSAKQPLKEHTPEIRSEHLQRDEKHSFTTV